MQSQNNEEILTRINKVIQTLNQVKNKGYLQVSMENDSAKCIRMYINNSVEENDEGSYTNNMIGVFDEVTKSLEKVLILLTNQ